MMNLFSKKLKTVLVLAILVCFAGLFTVTAQTICNNGTGSHGSLTYEYWKDSGSGCMTLGSNNTFSCDWSNINNLLARTGVRPGTGNEVITYSANYNPNGNSYLCIYGWTRNPLVEYYIVDSWGTWRPPGGEGFRGTLTSDGATYDIYRTQRVNQPSIDGNATFYQYWAVRQSKRTSGTITVRNHFNAWESNGMNMGNMYEVSFCVEGYQSSGTADITQLSFNGDPGPTSGPTATPRPTTPGSTPGPGDNVTVRASGTQSGGILELRVANQTIKSWTLSTTMADYTAEANGRIELHFTNDDNVDNGLDLQVDYLIYNGTTYEAEDQEVNTAVWNDSTSACGGSYSEQMHCNGYIEFDTGPVSTPVYSPTASPTATSDVTPLPDGRGLVKFASNSYTVGLNEALDVDVVVNSGSQDLAAYGITVSYGSSYLSVNKSKGESGVSEGSDGFIAAVNSEVPGLITISGFDTDGRGPGTNLHLVTIHFEGDREGDTTLSISVTDLADSSYEPIGVPVGGSASVKVDDSEPVTRNDPGYVGFDKDLYSVNPNGGALNVNVIANTGSQNLAAYGIVVNFDPGHLSLDSSQGDDGISEGDGFVAAAMIESGKITISGFDTEGKGPSSTLPLFTIHFKGEDEGTTEISINVSDLADSTYEVVGRPGGGSSSVEVSSTGTKGDVNGDGVVNIVDALMTAQFAVDMDPIGFNEAVADVNCDGVINIVDALMIAQYAVSMIDSFC